MILDTAMRLYLRDGIGAITMEAIAAEAEVTKPVVYACFPNRDAVLDALVAKQAADVAGHLATALAAAQDGETIEQALRLGCAAMLRSAQAEPGAYRASVLLEQGATAGLAARVRESTDGLVAMIGAAVEQRLAERGTPTTPEAAELVAHTLVQLGRGYILLMLRVDPPPPIETLAAITTRATLAVADELGIEVREPGAR